MRINFLVRISVFGLLIPSPCTVNGNECNMLSNDGPITILSSKSITKSEANVVHVTSSIVDTLDSVVSLYPNVNICIRCGSSVCLQQARQMSRNYTCLTSELISLPSLAAESPVEHWVREHAIVKVLSMQWYEAQLQVVTQLLVLWRYGGLVVPLGVKLNAIPTENSLNWIALVSTEGLPSLFPSEQRIALSLCGMQSVGTDALVMSAKPKTLYAFELMSGFVRAYPMQYSRDRWPVVVDWAAIFEGQCGLLLRGNAIGSLAGTSHNTTQALYGTLSYHLRHLYLVSVGNQGMNIGDEIQGMAGLQFLPYLSHFVERDDFKKTYGAMNMIDRNATQTSQPVANTGSITTFVNAWYGESTKTWPPPADIDAVLVGLHMELRTSVLSRSLNSIGRSYYRERGLVGLRDYSTSSSFRRLSVFSFFSGCLTMTLSFASCQMIDPENREVVIVDVPESILTVFVPADIREKAKLLSHKDILEATCGDIVARYSSAFDHIRIYSRAKLVITSR